MTVREQRRDATIDLMADHILRVGLGGANLRPLAVAANTSDRMLLYYFADKNELLAATFERIARRLTVQLDNELPAEPPRALPVLLEEIWEVLVSPKIQPYMHVWLELAAGAGRHKEPNRIVAGQIADGFLAWIGVRLDASEADRGEQAATLLAVIEGALVLVAVGRVAVADAAIRSAARQWSELLIR